MHRTDASHHIGVGRLTVESISRSTLRASVACSRQAALLFIIGALALSWIFVYFAGGVDSVVPHFYYIPILFAAVRFGPRSALVVALVSGVLAGPVTFAVVSDGSVQDLSRWLTRIAFFVGIGQMIAWTVGPTLAPIGEEVRRLRKELEIRGGIARREFYLMYQPILSLKSSRYVGVEALVRWRKSSGEEVSPADFISIAERSGLIHDLTAFVLEEACQQASIWHELADHNQQQPWYVSVNISGRDLGLPDLAEKIKLTMEKTGVPPSLLHVEITESELARQDAGEQLQQLRQLGVLIAIDDFGTGYSSLSYLQRFPIDILKIDRSLVSELGPEVADQALARGIVLLARSIGLETIAEGLESIDQLRIGRKLEFDYVQGFYFSRPLAADDVPALMHDPVPIVSE